MQKATLPNKKVNKKLKQISSLPISRQFSESRKTSYSPINSNTQRNKTQTPTMKKNQDRKIKFSNQDLKQKPQKEFIEPKQVSIKLQDIVNRNQKQIQRQNFTSQRQNRARTLSQDYDSREIKVALINLNLKKPIENKNHQVDENFNQGQKLTQQIQCELVKPILQLENKDTQTDFIFDYYKENQITQEQAQTQTIEQINHQAQEQILQQNKQQSQLQNLEQIQQIDISEIKKSIPDQQEILNSDLQDLNFFTYDLDRKEELQDHPDMQLQKNNEIIQKTYENVNEKMIQQFFDENNQLNQRRRQYKEQILLTKLNSNQQKQQNILTSLQKLAQKKTLQKSPKKADSSRKGHTFSTCTTGSLPSSREKSPNYIKEFYKNMKLQIFNSTNKQQPQSPTSLLRQRNFIHKNPTLQFKNDQVALNQKVNNFQKTFQSEIGVKIISKPNKIPQKQFLMQEKNKQTKQNLKKQLESRPQINANFLDPFEEISSVFEEFQQPIMAESSESAKELQHLLISATIEEKIQFQQDFNKNRKG